ncbi:MAG: TRAP transporter permease [Acidiferrobacteraceae bacterium]|nr:TRAP transporter permease [Acidiferrobacteraceae bacterium]MBT3770782.1 TRAP transporter permease [Acidiferrobacteraceae bacterium]MBT4406218.1 TRAP transporter permease [Acidiferrobacteraceae bacterium]MBT4806732.1 TRAP transporter permease [Acidiferrobacteraceae bacterium]MBT5887058.1 TRAP transporter permease [Acidiferrobacteraceae bacterium]
MVAQLDVRQVEELEEKYDSGLQFREIGPWLVKFTFLFSVFFAAYHYVTAGTGVPVDYWHMGFHMSGVIILVFILYPMIKRGGGRQLHANTWWRFSNVPIWDWLLILAGVSSSLYVGITWYEIDFELLGWHFFLPEQVLRQGDPAFIDVVFGTILIAVLLEAVRRTLGIVVPIIILLFTSYAVFGQYMPLMILKHPGINWAQYINNMYFPAEGIYGVTLWIVSTVVFHFVLFGVLAQRMGLGQFFVDIATVMAGRYTGGLAKVSVVSSAFFGTISGSSIANTVSTGSLTIPNMKRMGYPGHLAGGVEAASSAGGQITPPIMGAAAFVMAEFLEVPYTTIVLAAMVPAAMHYLGVLSIVHFKAKRLGLKGLPAEEIPRLLAVLKRGWPTALPLAALIYVLFSGYSPHMAAFWGITTALAVGLVNPMHRIGLRDILDGCVTGVRYALAVGAVCAAIGIVVGVVNSTGLGFRLGFMVTNGALSIGESLYSVFSWIPLFDFSVQGITLFVSLILIAITCILMGAGLPTTALYIMLVTVAQPALANLGVPPLASHLFVLYYGVISEITPPVCASAYAAAGIAGANPFRTGVSAFTLGIAKLMVPMVFVYSPAMLIVIEDYFTWSAFLSTTLSCAVGIFMVATSVAGFFLVRMPVIIRWAMAFSGILLVAPGMQSDLFALVFVAPVLIQQVTAWRRAKPVVSQNA